MNTPLSLGHLRILSGALDSIKPHRNPYFLPSLWADPTGIPPAGGVIPVVPQSFYSGIVRRLLETPAAERPGGEGGEWSSHAVVYNMMIRTTCSFDHDNDGRIGIQPGRGGWRETGTFLKAIAILPYIRSLGVNTLHLLPLFDIGMDGRRGTMGSPYAIRDFNVIDPTLAEPSIDLSADIQFRAFLEAARHSGFRVVLEIPLRTVAKDHVWAKEHPDWFYWMRDDAEFHTPRFSRETLKDIHTRISSGNFQDLPEPDDAYRRMFSEPPPAESIRLAGTGYQGMNDDGRNVVVPSAFADWPPDDLQPVWEDITYLKYHQVPGFNYPAYNTVRMYDSTLAGRSTATASLWETLRGVVRRLAGEYGLDGLMFDMAHALPDELVRDLIEEGRSHTPDFAFWAEDFSRTEAQKLIGYNAVLGGQWACQHVPGDFRDMLKWISETPLLPPHLATPETHNTPRAAARHGGRKYSAYAWAVSNFIPGIPYLHSGFELYESAPVNTGLGFTSTDLRKYNADSLPLFSAGSLRWTGPGHMVAFVRRVSQIRTYLQSLIVPTESDTPFTLLDGGDAAVLAFLRLDAPAEKGLLVAANTDMDSARTMKIFAGNNMVWGKDLISGARFKDTKPFVTGTLDPGQVVVLPVKN